MEGCMDIDWESAFDADAKALPKLIERAEAGNHEVALRLLDIFGARVYSGREPYFELLTYLAKCTAKLVSGAERDANKAFNLGKPRHRPKTTAYRERDEVLAFRVEVLREGGMSRDPAIKQVAEQAELSFDTVLNAYKQYSALFQAPSKKRRPRGK
jgi:hypothetical protein